MNQHPKVETAAEERRAIVAWLREWRQVLDGPQQRHHRSELVGMLAHLAAAIDKGEHRRTRT